MENSNHIESSPDLVVSEENTSIGDLLNLYLTALFNGNAALFNDLRMSIDSKKRNGSEVWQGLENHIGRLQLYIACFFADAGIAIDTTGADGQQMAIPTTPRPKGIEAVRYVAANFRGLYQTNGRQTLIGLSGGLLRKAPDVEAHKTLHEIYMRELVHKSESINQLFLANTRLSALSVHFVDQPTSRIGPERQLGTADLFIGRDISDLWSDQRETWSAVADRVLAGHADPGAKRQCEILMSQSRKTILRRVSRHAFSLLSSDLFKGWLKLPHSKQITDAAVTAIEEFELWLLSVCWLSFYCNHGHAGEFFYTMRMPGILPVADSSNQLGDEVAPDLPASSLSLVSEQPLPSEVLDQWIGVSASLAKVQGFKDSLEAIRLAYEQFDSQRHDYGAPGELHELAQFVSPSSLTASAVPSVCFVRVRFLLDMARRLVNLTHEGRPMRFCFIFGFSWERIDSESSGFLPEIVGDLRTQWMSFEEKWLRKGLPDPPDSPDVADAMAKWIKTTDLPLQPWDVALFLEEAPDLLWPLPTSIVRITDHYPATGDHITTEFQLRRALKKITQQSSTTVAVLADRTGLILFAHDKSVLLQYEGERLKSVGMWKEKEYLTDEDVFKQFLLSQLRTGPFAELSQNTRADACDIISDLCEALVTLGHGGLMVLRAPSAQDERLPPLNPTWRVQPGENGPELREGILTYALLAALDGATEIRFLKNNGPIAVSVRRCVLSKTEIWMVDKDGDVILCPPFDEDKANRLNLIGKGTRHHSALALSSDLKGKAIILTVSADGPVTVWRDGKCVEPTVPGPQGKRVSHKPRFKP